MPNRSNAVLEKILDQVDLPESAYETAERRYEDLGSWLHRPESACSGFDPQVTPQGSFRLGTAIRPEDDEEYDLDMGCILRQGLNKTNITQKDLKELLGGDLEAYRNARNIKEELDEKDRCWRLVYADDMNFHLDVVPSIPESDFARSRLRKRMVEASQLDEGIAQSVSALALSITDRTDENYAVVSDRWRISNPEGYAKWFESRMRLAQQYLAEREMVVKASIDDLPYYRWKTPLQHCIQLLKRHRDTMFKDKDDNKPISVIITTLAARAYNGESDLAEALANILGRMDRFINASVARVPNPVNPDEDFADKWYSSEHAHLELEENFHLWLTQARAHFRALLSRDNSQAIIEAADAGLDINLDRSAVELALGLSAAVAKPATAIEPSNARPWHRS
ncbi:nucleotidyltransferase domain-containing protein [Haliea atlantica]